MHGLEIKLEYSFKNSRLLLTALTHSSYANENRSEGIESNERLEFLGDSVLGQVVAAHLYLNCPKMPEGQMTRLRAELVCEHSLFKVSKELELGSYIRLGRGEEHTGGRSRESILADAVEAIIAAIYLDGGMEVAKAFIHKHLLDGVELGHFPSNSDCKTTLQELIQRKPNQTISYETVAERGPDHNKTFTVAVQLNGQEIGKGVGRTKKEAEQAAARTALEELSE